MSWIGQGGFGDVYRGRWITTDTEVAIKVLHHNAFTETADKEFLDEIVLMHSIRGYDHVISLLGACIESERRCLVMEYCPRGNLYNVLRTQPAWTWCQRVDIAYQIVKSINYLHVLESCVLHRDIKSMNFLVKGDDANLIIKVCDFGLAHVRHESTLQQYTTSAFRGTIAWTAPEQLALGARKPKYSTACDVYSIGIVLWELATGELPYAGESSESIRSAVKCGEREDIPSEVPHYFREWIMRCWHHDPLQRPSCQTLLVEMKSKLTPLLQHHNHAGAHDASIDPAASSSLGSSTATTVGPSASFSTESVMTCSLPSNLGSISLSDAPGVTDALSMLDINAICARLSDLATA